MCSSLSITDIPDLLSSSSDSSIRFRSVSDVSAGISIACIVFSIK